MSTSISVEIGSTAMPVNEEAISDIRAVFRPYRYLWLPFSSVLKEVEEKREKNKVINMKYRCRTIFGIVVSIISILILWADTIRFATIFRFDFALSASQASALSYMLYLLANAFLITAFRCYGLKGHIKHIQELENYFSKYGYSFDMKKYRRMAPKIVFHAVWIALLWSGVEFAPTLIPDISEDSLFKRRLTPVNTEEGNLGLYALATGTFVLHFFVSLTLASLFFYYVVVIYIYCYEFSSVTCKLKKLVDTPDIFISQLEPIRQQYENLVRMLSTANSLAGHFAFFGYALPIPFICLFLYTLLDGSIPLYDLIVFIFIVVNSCAHTICVTAAGIRLNSHAHEPLDTLLQVDTSTFDDKALQRMHLFVSRLTASPIGISVYGMFVIEKSTILMVVGTILTYFIIIFEMRPEQR